MALLSLHFGTVERPEVPPLRPVECGAFGACATSRAPGAWISRSCERLSRAAVAIPRLSVLTTASISDPGPQPRRCRGPKGPASAVSQGSRMASWRCDAGSMCWRTAGLRARRHRGPFPTDRGWFGAARAVKALLVQTISDGGMRDDASTDGDDCVSQASVGTVCGGGPACAGRDPDGDYRGDGEGGEHHDDVDVHARC